MQEPRIGPDLFAFLRELKENNNRDWFEANKTRYESAVREPLLQFIREFGFRLGAISRNFVADPRRVGGSLFRIHRDVRFSKDKRPYKTAAGMQFRHLRGKDVHAPGFYLHLEPDGCFLGMGMWRPDNPTQLRVRSAIVGQPERWKSIFEDSQLAARFKLGGDILKRAPKGFDPMHALIEDIRRKDFVIFENLEESDALKPNFVDRFAASCEVGSPFVRFLTEAVDLPW